MLLTLLALPCGACAYGVRSTALPPHLKSVAVPVFENGTTEYTLEQDITDAVIRRFVQDNQLKVADERTATAVLRGKVIFYRNTVFGFSDPTLASEYRVTIGVSVVFKDQIKNREIWSDDNLVRTANYYVIDVPGQPAQTEIDGRRAAILKIADEILNRTVQGW